MDNNISETLKIQKNVLVGDKLEKLEKQQVKKLVLSYCLVKHPLNESSFSYNHLYNQNFFLVFNVFFVFASSFCMSFQTALFSSSKSLVLSFKDQFFPMLYLFFRFLWAGFPIWGNRVDAILISLMSHHWKFCHLYLFKLPLTKMITSW